MVLGAPGKLVLRTSDEFLVLSLLPSLRPRLWALLFARPPKHDVVLLLCGIKSLVIHLKNMFFVDRLCESIS